jgi:hypothetical protein
MDDKHKIIKVINHENKLDSIVNYENVLNKILCISLKINETQENIIDKINNLDERITNIEKKMEKNNTNNTNNDSLNCSNLKELKKEDLMIDKDDVLNALKYRDYRSVMYIFKHIYKNKIKSEYVYPIKIVSKRTFEYYNNNKWNTDLYGYYCISVICSNIQNLFTKYNNIDSIDSDDFIMNQQFIFKLSDEKYQKSIFKNIIEEVRINNI